MLDFKCPNMPMLRDYLAKFESALQNYEGSAPSAVFQAASDELTNALLDMLPVKIRDKAKTIKFSMESCMHTKGSLHHR